MEKQLFKVYFPNGSFHSLKHSSNTLIRDIITTVLRGRVYPHDLPFRLCFSIRAIQIDDQLSPEIWLPSEYSMGMVKSMLNAYANWRFELRVRYFPQDLNDLMEKDKATFNYLHEQLKHDYMKLTGERTSTLSAIQLGCLEIRKLFRDLNPSALEKKINIDYLEKEIGLRKFFPASLLSNVKGRVLRRLIKTYLKEYEGLDENNCMLKYMRILKTIWNFDQEWFKGALGVGWAVPIEIVVGPDEGISYSTSEQSSNLTKITNFENIASISPQYFDDGKSTVFVCISGIPEPLSISFQTKNDAMSVAHLLDGYCMLFKDSCISLLDNLNENDMVPQVKVNGHKSKKVTVEALEKEVTAGSLLLFSSDYIINKSSISVIERLGQGQFGEVYRGTFQDSDGCVHRVAVKVCKEDDPSTTERFLSEAYVMHKFHHPHIIRLFGVCPSSPILIVMELAEFGELRSFLRANNGALKLLTLVLFCFQIASALDFLESKNFVHRDIAARNVLVTSKECTKLADFGLSRELESNYYRASKGKLPIKWMAPESINFRRFTHSSDVWMFGVCMWEILMFGMKPYQGVPNSLVIEKIECGDRLKKPSICPDDLYQIMTSCWHYEPSHRPSFSLIKLRIQEVYYRLCSKRFDSEVSPQVQRSESVPAGSNQHELEWQLCRKTVSDRCDPYIDLVQNSDDASKRSEGYLVSLMGERKTISTATNLYQSFDMNPAKCQHDQISHENDHDVVNTLHSQTKQVVGAVLSLNMAVSNGTTCGKDIIPLVKAIGLAVRDLLRGVDTYTALIYDENKRAEISSLQESIADHVASMIQELKNNSLESVIRSGIDIAKLSKKTFDYWQDSVDCSSFVRINTS